MIHWLQNIEVYGYSGILWLMALLLIGIAFLKLLKYLLSGLKGVVLLFTMASMILSFISTHH